MDNPPPTTTDGIDKAVAELTATKLRWQREGGLSLASRASLVEDCLAHLAAAAEEWIDAACQAKGTDPNQTDGAEEIMAGPLATARCLRLMLAIVQQAQSATPPTLRVTTQKFTGQAAIDVFPARAGLFDKVLFRPFGSQVWLQPGADAKDAQTTALLRDQSVQSRPAVCLVLGAGNVSSIAPTDLFSKLFLHGRAVLLKMNPVNAYLGPIFEKALRPLFTAGCLRMIYGGAEVGQYAVAHPGIDEVHITGSAETHRRIVFGNDSAGEDLSNRQPVLQKPITSELGNVTPWIIIPGRYSPRDLAFQAESLAASIVNNASFNCVATKMIVTQRNWPQRAEFLDRIEAILRTVPRRKAYYPGAAERFARFTGQDDIQLDDQGALPWALLRDVSPERDERLFQEESFVCVTAETALDGENPAEFLDCAVELANDRLWGTLACSLTAPTDFRRSAGGEERLWKAIAKLRYGSVALNHWVGLAFAWMSTPWGGYPGGTLADPHSGVGWVHDVFVSRQVEKSILTGPLVVRPKSAWLPTHRRAAPLAREALDLYLRPSIFRLSRVLLEALRG